MSITWTGISAETPFSSSSVLAVLSFLAGFPNTVTVTGPGGGTYSALVRIHDANGNVVGTVPVSSSAALPASMSLPEGSDRYGYSLAIVSGAVPVEGVMIQVRGGKLDRFPAPPMFRNPTTGALEASGPIAVVYDGIAMRQNTLIYSPSARVPSSYNLTTEGNIFTYTIPASLALEFRNGYRIIRDRLMLGINRGDLVGNLLMKQYWNNVLVSSLVISASVNGWSGTPVANQNKVLDVVNEVSNDNSVANQNLNDGMSYLRSHWEWKTMYTGTTPFGLMGETMYGATKFDLNSDIAVRWTAQWSGGPGSLYVDTIEVTF